MQLISVPIHLNGAVSLLPNNIDVGCCKFPDFLLEQNSNCARQYLGPQNQIIQNTHIFLSTCCWIFAVLKKILKMLLLSSHYSPIFAELRFHSYLVKSDNLVKVDNQNFHECVSSIRGGDFGLSHCLLKVTKLKLGINILPVKNP